MDEEGEVRWKRKYAQGEISVSTIINCADGGIVFGHTIRYGESENGPNANHAYIVRLASDGTLQWRRRFGPRRKDGRVTALATRSDGQIVAAGSTGPPDARSRSTVLVEQYQQE